MPTRPAVGGATGVRRAIAAAALTATAMLAAASPALGAAQPAAAAAAAPVWHACGTRIQCARVVVPLDRSGTVPGSVALYVRRHLAASRPIAQPAPLVVLAGGPGQAAAPLLGDFLLALGPLVGKRDIVTYDQRGTGRSGVLRCPGLERAGDASPDRAPLRHCAATLGARRAFYTTPDSVEDLEAVRVALGAPKLAIDGISYGTKLAEAYAIAHPDHVERLVLDSAVLPEGPDPFERSTLVAIPRVLRALCAGTTCRGMTADPAADLARLVQRTRRAPLHIRSFDAHGRPHGIVVRPSTLLSLAVEGDLDSTLRAATPGAIAAALHGDGAPLGRLVARSDEADEEIDSPQEFSVALFVATSCEDTPFPWNRASTAAARLAALRSAAAAIPEADFGPFGRATEIATDLGGMCAAWPLAPSPRFVPAGPFPAVPALVLSGAQDTRTPNADARALTARLPRGELVTVPAAGHDVTDSDAGGCAARALRRFFAGRAVGRCVTTVRLRATRPPPRRLPRAPRFGFGARRDRTLAAVLVTIVDAAVQLASGSSTGGGLRGGSYHVDRHGLALRDYVAVAGYRVSGNVRPGGQLVIGGTQASTGTLRLTAAGGLRGRLGGRRIHIGGTGLADAATTARAATAAAGPRRSPLYDVTRLRALGR